MPYSLLLLLVLTASATARAEGLAARVIVLANRADPDSLRIARHYAEVRGVPAGNIFALPMPQTETITWSEFVETIWQPLQDALVRTRWIDAIPMKLIDPIGRTKLAFSGHRIAYLVTCRGVPLRIMHDPARYAASPSPTDNPLFRTNASAVDSELSLLAHPNYPVNAYIDNPLFNDDHPTPGDLASVIKVSRLDGPDVADALALVDRAVEAERVGLIGRAYIDLGGNHPDGDRWLEAVLRQLQDLGFDADADRKPSTFPLSARFDSPVLYFGWYAPAINGPFTLPGFRFPPGAIALHIHSYSAQTLHSDDAHWTGPFVARGVTATVGNVFEPYLQLTHRPDLLLRALARGENWGDAATYAAPALSWQTVAIGDPLYRPFATPLDAQWANRSRLSNEDLGYVVVRRMLVLEASRKPAEALALGTRVQHDRPSLSLGVAVAERQFAQGNWSGVSTALGAVLPANNRRPDQWALQRDAAALLAKAGHPAEALAGLHRLLDLPELPVALKQVCLADAVKDAELADDREQAASLRQQLEALTPDTPVQP